MKWLGSLGHDVEALWGRMERLIALTLLPFRRKLARKYKQVNDCGDRQLFIAASLLLSDKCQLFCVVEWEI